MDVKDVFTVKPKNGSELAELKKEIRFFKLKMFL